MAKIIGTPVGTTMPRPDWNQTDPTKADYIKNKPQVDQTYSPTSKNAQSGLAVAEGVVSTTDALQTAYSYILQGRNLLRETNQGIKRWGYVHNGSEYTIVPSTEDDGKGVQLTVTKGGSYGFLQYDIHELLYQLEPNTRYSLGFDYKATSGTLINATIQNINASGQLTDIQKPSLVGDNTWHRCEVALATNDLGNITNQVLYIYLYTFVGELSIRNLKFEKGSQATEWCPAPEDVIGDRLELAEAMSKAFDVVEQYVVDHPKEEWITIGEYTATEETPNHDFATDIHGNPFLCKKIMVYVAFPQALAANTNYGIKTNIFELGGTMFTNITRLHYYADVAIGAYVLVGSECYDNGNWLGNGTQKSQLFPLGADAKPINYVLVSNWSGMFPIGTQIKVWGLKA